MATWPSGWKHIEHGFKCHTHIFLILLYIMRSSAAVGVADVNATDLQLK
jgi:hypothetical protein